MTLPNLLEEQRKYRAEKGQEGIFTSMTSEEYHASDAVSSSFLKKLHTTTPGHAMAQRVSDVQQAIFDLGTAAHTALLEPDRMGKDIVEGPDAARNTKVWKEFVADQKEGAICLKSEDYQRVLAMARAALEIDVVSNLVLANDRVVEASAFWHDAHTGLHCRVRPDLYVPSKRIMLDYKTSASASASMFGQSVGRYAYHLQQAMYVDGWLRAGGGKTEAFYFLAQEKEEPYACQLFELDADAANRGQQAYRTALEQYRSCLATRTWPCYPREVQLLGLPKWIQ
jgi:hypothetical protein